MIRSFKTFLIAGKLNLLDMPISSINLIILNYVQRLVYKHTLLSGNRK